MKRTLTLLAMGLIAAGATAQATFSDISEAAGINNKGKNYGVAIGDYDNDGREDIYVSRHGAPNLLYRNIGNDRFVDMAAVAGVGHIGTTTVSTWGDIDNDGDLDLYLGNRDEANVLYRNNGDGTFTDISESAGVNSGHRTRAILFGDVNNDGFIDLYVANMTATNYMYINNGDNTFTDRTLPANVQDFGVAMGSLFFDYDNDGDLDLYLTHDANQPNILYRNDGTGRFADVSAAANANYAGQGMGVDFGDVNNDGFFDLYITNLYANALLLNNGDGTFTEITESAEVGDLGMGWGTSWLDYDNDGRQDIYVCNDSYFSPYPNLLYQNMGGNNFRIQSQYSSLSSMYGGYGLATADLNADGRVDLFIANSGNDGNQLLSNRMNNDNSWVKVKLAGTASNRSAIGARVRIETGGVIHIDEVCAGNSYASQNSMTLHFGLGQAQVIDQLEVRWPSGLVETFENLAVRQSYLITEAESMVTATSAPALPQAQLQVGPTPFTDMLQLQFELAEAGNIQLFITGLDGRPLAILADERLPKGSHQYNWAPAALPAGIYFCHLVTAGGRHTARAVRSR